MRWILLFGLLVAAIACYLIGSVKAMGLFLVLGVFLEIAFWLGILKTNKRKVDTEITR